MEIGYILFRKKDSKIFSIKRFNEETRIYTLSSNDDEILYLNIKQIRKYFN